MYTRHTDYIHNYMKIRDMLRHVGWLGFWMNCALNVIKTENDVRPISLSSHLDLSHASSCRRMCVCVCWKSQKAYLKNRWLGHVAARVVVASCLGKACGRV